ncbi:MAG: penicillin-binding transpeptidase domain-containing protein, partial [Pseudomonadota bacterium]
LAKEFSATAVVMNIQSGEIYALASQPSFDPNDFSRGLTAEIWEGLLANPGKPLNNKAVTGQYPPASTFKMITAIAAMRSDNVKRSFKAYCPGFYNFGRERFHCWEKRGHGHVDVEEAIMKSCDIYFYKVATEIGIESIAEVARELGLGDKLGFEITEEAPGLVPDKNWKLGYVGETWQPGETIVSSIGQGYLKTTPLQLATMTARLISGKAVKPHIVYNAGGEVTKVPEFPDLKIEPSHLRMVKRAMDRVVNDKEGTAYHSRIRDEGFEMGGKTGTAQVKRITKEERAAGIKNEDLERRFRHHGLFVGYAPLNKPKYACAVVVEHGGGGSASAAPIARDILKEVQRRDLANTPVQIAVEQPAEQMSKDKKPDA